MSQSNVKLNDICSGEREVARMLLGFHEICMNLSLWLDARLFLLRDLRMMSRDEMLCNAMLNARLRRNEIEPVMIIPPAVHQGNRIINPPLPRP